MIEQIVSLARVEAICILFSFHAFIFSVLLQTRKMLNNINQYNLLGTRPSDSSAEDSWLSFNWIIQIVLKTKCLKTESKKTFYY